MKKKLLHTLILYLLGLILGGLIVYLFRDLIWAPLHSTWSQIKSQFLKAEIDRHALLVLALEKQAKYLLLLWVFSLTNIWKYYSRGFTIFYGFKHGLLLALCLYLRKGMGLLGWFCFLFPQVIFYLLGFYLSLCHGDYINRELHHGSSKKQLLFAELPYVLLSCIILFLGCCCEGYLNLPLLRFFLA